MSVAAHKLNCAACDQLPAKNVCLFQFSLFNLGTVIISFWQRYLFEINTYWPLHFPPSEFSSSPIVCLICLFYDKVSISTGFPENLCLQIEAYLEENHGTGHTGSDNKWAKGQSTKHFIYLKAISEQTADLPNPAQYSGYIHIRLYKWSRQCWREQGKS
jgi:hypothetical protein